LNGTKECELRLLENRSTTLQCDHGAVVAAGHYTWDGEKLTLTWTAYTRDRAKAPPPDPLSFKVKGEGNSMKAAHEGQIYTWSRHLK